MSETRPWGGGCARGRAAHSGGASAPESRTLWIFRAPAKKATQGSFLCSPATMNPASIHEDAGSIHGFAQWAKELVLSRVGHRSGSDPVLLWLWCRSATAARIGLLAWELPYASGVALKRQKRRKKEIEKEKENVTVSSRDYSRAQNRKLQEEPRPQRSLCAHFPGGEQRPCLPQRQDPGLRSSASSAAPWVLLLSHLSFSGRSRVTGCESPFFRRKVSCCAPFSPLKDGRPCSRACPQ